jgi:L-ascorbate metabolism protein UlaG (beta-lactamase superfamily)
VASPGLKATIAGIVVEAVPAYTVLREEHERAKGWVGYLLTVGGGRVYHSGATDLVPELRQLTCDIAILGFYENWIMDTGVAAELARSLHAKVVVPIHHMDGAEQALKKLLDGVVRVAIKPNLAR